MIHSKIQIESKRLECGGSCMAHANALNARSYLVKTKQYLMAFIYLHTQKWGKAKQKIMGGIQPTNMS